MKGCWCYDCAVKVPRNPDNFFDHPTNRIITCPSCGNKRCPRATNHEETCTSSNEPGQPGSRY